MNIHNNDVYILLIVTSKIFEEETYSPTPYKKIDIVAVRH